MPETIEPERRRDLTPAEREIIDNKGTEPPFSGIYNDFKETGVYRCKACGQKLFASEAKYDSSSGWPSFVDPMQSDAVTTAVDDSLGMRRIEIMCNACGAHLGHVFDDGPTAMPDGSPASGKRYCVNSLALDFEPREP